MDRLRYFCLVLLCFMRVFLFMPCGHLLGKLSFVMSNCEIVTFPLVSWVRCGAWLNKFLSFALFSKCVCYTILFPQLAFYSFLLNNVDMHRYARLDQNKPCHSIVMSILQTADRRTRHDLRF